ncbi:hypothetical protein [Peribacillus deserti]|uniref:Uncharacterized protein n=1 Tax=Peribacillus deserti TaxID=673318 RepID=A0A2N5M7X8_9BACI|nr:hypothetical protein [Peribacillus deserti]PLT30474.1 hypothetical protein CUU66_07370 [Peribacillus deserti]
MKGSNLQSVLDFKKLTVVQLQIILDELQQNQSPKKKLEILTATSIIKGEIRAYEPEEMEKEPILSQALMKSEKEPLLDISTRELINIHACLYLKNVKIQPIASPDTSIHLEELVLFTDHIQGITWN